MFGVLKELSKQANVLGLYRDQEYCETDPTFLLKKSQHSLNNVWNEIALQIQKEYGNQDASKNQKVFIANAGQGYLIHHLKEMGFNDVLGIDLQRDFIEHFQKSCPTYRLSASVQNFFRYKDTELGVFDTFIFSKILEYVDDPLSYVNRVPKGKKIVITFPNFDDGLVLRYFENEPLIRNFFKDMIDIQDMKTINLFINHEFLIDQRMYVLSGLKL